LSSSNFLLTFYTFLVYYTGKISNVKAEISAKGRWAPGPKSKIQNIMIAKVKNNSEIVVGGAALRQTDRVGLGQVGVEGVGLGMTVDGQPVAGRRSASMVVPVGTEFAPRTLVKVETSFEPATSAGLSAEPRLEARQDLCNPVAVGEPKKDKSLGESKFTRRDFLKLVGAGTAVAGLAELGRRVPPGVATAFDELAKEMPRETREVAKAVAQAVTEPPLRRAEAAGLQQEAWEKKAITVGRGLVDRCIQIRKPDGSIYYSFTPKDNSCGQDWCQEVRTNAHENLSCLGVAASGDVETAKGMLRPFFKREKMQTIDYGKYQYYPYLVKPDVTLTPNDPNNWAAMPLVSWQAKTVYDLDPKKDKGFLKEAFSTGVQHHRYWIEKRGTQQGLPAWKNHWESVRDDPELPTWKATKGAENQCPVDLACYLVANARTLSAMAQELGLPKEAKVFNKQAEGLTRVINEKMWDEQDGCYYGIRVDNGKKVRVKDFSTLLPLFAGVANEQQAKRLVEEHLLNPEEFATKYPIPSLAKNEEGYSSSRIWLGGNLPQMTTLVVDGLMRYGYENEARRIAKQMLEMASKNVQASGHLHELNDSETGEGIGHEDYIWANTFLHPVRTTGLLEETEKAEVPTPSPTPTVKERPVSQQEKKNRHGRWKLWH